MKGWTWSPMAMSWHEWLLFSLAYVVHSEGRFFYSDLVRGIAVGLFVSALLVTLANRRAAVALFCVLGVTSSFGMTPQTPRPWALIETHVLAAFILLGPLLSRWLTARRARRAEQAAATP